MNIALRVAKVSIPTGNTLAGLLEKHGIKITRQDVADAVVSYGVGYEGPLPCLNAKAGSLDNYQQLKALWEAGVPVPPFVDSIEHADFAHIQFPLLARDEKHHGGKDIKPVLQEEELEWRKASGSQFFTQYIPIRGEYRAWVYRRKLKAVYRKDMKYPMKFNRIGRNFQNGFAFEFVKVEDRPPVLEDIAAKAVFVLGLDFGAVDLIDGKDGKFYVLEVNSAPGVQGDTRQGVTALALSVKRWAVGGFKKQNTTWR